MTSTPMLTRVRRFVERDDAGSALVITMMVLAIVTGLGTTMYVMSVRNLKNAGRDRQATAALSDSEAGVGQAIAYIRANGVGGLACSPSCASNPWGNSSAPQAVTLASGETYQVWIEPITPLVPGSGQPGTYRVHSVGQVNGGTAQRTVTEDLSISPFSYPLAVYGDQINAGGTGQILTESLFSNGCIFKRSKIKFSGVDPVYGIPSAAHSSTFITDSQSNGQSCAATDSNNIHYPDPKTTTPDYCNSAYPFDQDSQGGDLSTYANPCYQAGASMAGSDPTYPKSSYTNNVAATWKFQQAGLSSAQLDLLRSAAESQGFYFTNTSAIPTVLQSYATAQNYPNPVLFYDLQGSAVGSVVDLSNLDSTEYGRPTPLSATSSQCTSHNFILVVLNGNVRLNSNSVLVGSVFAMGPDPNGQVFKANGTSNLIGTIYSRQLDLTGTANINLDGCFLANLPGSLLNVQSSTFREVDR